MSTQITNSGNYIEEALSYLNNPDNFPSFSQGLTKLIYKYSYTGSEDNVREKTDFIYAKLASIGVSVTKSTIADWFSDKRRPGLASNSRMMMYQVCFALSVSLEDVRWFFRCVYFDRSFNRHTITEAVYYYCFSNHYHYSHAMRLIRAIDDMPLIKPIENHGTILTTEICEGLNHCSSDEELLSFFRENKGFFFKWNQYAAKCIHEYREEICGKESDKEVVQNAKKGKDISPRELSECGLVIQEFLKFHDKSHFDIIFRKNITSTDFMLDRIFDTAGRIHKKVKLPKIVRTNFPSKKVFSKLLNDINLNTSTSYDSIRKCLIFLGFYRFWCRAILEPAALKENQARAYDIYLFETNTQLLLCGYEELFWENPYDCLFLWAAKSQSPLDSFREVICEIFDEE